MSEDRLITALDKQTAYRMQELRDTGMDIVRQLRMLETMLNDMGFSSTAARVSCIGSSLADQIAKSARREGE